MAKLFGSDNVIETPSAVGPIPDEYISTEELSFESDDSFILRSARQADTIHTINKRLSKLKKGSVEYFVSIENYKLMMDNIADDLGVKRVMPGLESFGNSYAMEASHSITVEGFWDTLKKIWEKIKEFFKAFMKKVTDFYKRLTKSNLDVDMYDKYLNKLMSDIRSKS